MSPYTTLVSVKQVEVVEVVERSYRDGLPIPLLSCESWMFVKENPDRKKHHGNEMTEF